MKNVHALRRENCMNSVLLMFSSFYHFRENVEIKLRHWWHLPCLKYLLFNYSVCFMWRKKPRWDGRVLILKTLCCNPISSTLRIHDAKPVTVFDFHITIYAWGKIYHSTMSSQSVSCGCSYLFKQLALFPPSDHWGGSPGHAQISSFVWERRGGECATLTLKLSY